MRVLSCNAHAPATAMGVGNSVSRDTLFGVVTLGELDMLYQAKGERILLTNRCRLEYRNQPLVRVDYSKGLSIIVGFVAENGMPIKYQRYINEGVDEWCVEPGRIPVAQLKRGKPDIMEIEVPGIRSKRFIVQQWEPSGDGKQLSVIQVSQQASIKVCSETPLDDSALIHMLYPIACDPWQTYEYLTNTIYGIYVYDCLGEVCLDGKISSIIGLNIPPRGMGLRKDLPWNPDRMINAMRHEAGHNLNDKRKQSKLYSETIRDSSGNLLFGTGAVTRYSNGKVYYVGYVSPGAVDNHEEDFAETHADLLECREAHMLRFNPRGPDFLQLPREARRDILRDWRKSPSRGERACEKLDAMANLVIA